MSTLESFEGETGVLFPEEFVALFCFVVAVVVDDGDVAATEADVAAVVVLLVLVSSVVPVVSVTLV